MASSLRQPPDSYKFDNFITDISKEILVPELEELKRRFKDIFDADVRDAYHMFKSMERKGYIDCYNIIYIQQILRVLGRGDLLEKASKYVKLIEEDRVLHFFRRTTRTASGFEIVEFHVKGKNRISSYEDLETFRRKISTILLVPLHEVIFNGVQETGSLTIIVMIPTMYIDFLHKQLMKNAQHIIQYFTQLEVDQITISRDMFKLRKEGSAYIAEKISVSATKAYSSGKCKATKQEKEQKCTSFETIADIPDKETMKRTIISDEETKSTIVTRSVSRQGFSMPKMRKQQIAI